MKPVHSCTLSNSLDNSLSLMGYFYFFQIRKQKLKDVNKVS